jgi:hypothetical protein
MKLAPVILCVLPLLTGCMHKPLTAGQNLLLTAPPSSRPKLVLRVPPDAPGPASDLRH